MSSSGTPAAAAARNLMEREPRGPNTTSVARASHAWPAHREPPRRETVAPYLVRSAEPNPLSATRGRRSVEGAGAGVRAGTAAAGVALDLDFDAEAFFDFDAGVFDFADGFSAGDLCAGVFSAGVFSAGVFSAGVFASAGDFLAGVFALGALGGRRSLLRRLPAGAAPRTLGGGLGDGRRRLLLATASAPRGQSDLFLFLFLGSLLFLDGLFPVCLGKWSVTRVASLLRHQHRLLLATAASPRGPPPPLLLLPPPPHSASA